MFTGIIEAIGSVKEIITNGSNLNLTVISPISQALKVDQSIAHNGVCLTVTELIPDGHKVTAIRETIEKTNLGTLQPGDKLNLERCLPVNGRLDGHMVQGHVDQRAIVNKIETLDGSWSVQFQWDGKQQGMVVPKGSVCVNGVSLTVVDVLEDGFNVAIIPYTWEHTVFHTFQKGSKVNIEFDILGKYFTEWMKHYSVPQK